MTVATLDDVAVEDRASRWDPEIALEMQELYTEIAGLPEHLRMALIAVDMLGLSYREARTRAQGARDNYHHAAAATGSSRAVRCGMLPTSVLYLVGAVGWFRDPDQPGDFVAFESLRERRGIVTANLVRDGRVYDLGRSGRRCASRRGGETHRTEVVIRYGDIRAGKTRALGDPYDVVRASATHGPYAPATDLGLRAPALSRIDATSILAGT